MASRRQEKLSVPHGQLRWVAVAALTLVACSTAPPKQANEVDSVAAADPGDDPVELSDPEPVEQVPPPAPVEKAEPDPGSDDYEINHRDCEALARAYARSWFNDEKAILDDKGLNQSQYDKILAQIEDDSRGMFDNYISQCGNTVGTTYLRSRLQCAAKAQTMKRFDDCMEGRAAE